MTTTRKSRLERKRERQERLVEKYKDVNLMATAVRLIKAGVGLLVLNFLFNGAIELQVQERNKRLDQMEESIQSLSDSVDAIEEVAGQVDVDGDPEMAARLEDVFQKIDELYSVIVVQQTITGG